MRDPSAQQIAAEIADFRQRAWAIRGELMPAIREVLLRADLQAAYAERLQALEAGPRDRDQNVTPGGVAILPLHGMIRPGPSLLGLLFGFGGGGLLSFRQSLRELLGNDDVTGIVIDVDSPGGLADLVAETASEVYAARGQKPIVAIANTMCCSAAYWIASQADEFVITPSGSAGSIGVYAVHDDWSGANEAMGLKPTYIKAGKFKAEANPDEPLSETAHEHLQEMVDSYYADFVADVARGRDASVDEVKNGFGEGRTLVARACVSERIADRIATFEEIVGELASGNRGTRAVADAGAEAGGRRAGDPFDELDEETEPAESDDEPASADDENESGDEDRPDDESGESDESGDEPEASDLTADQRRQVAELLFS